MSPLIRSAGSVGDDFLDHGFAQRRQLDVRCVLRRQHDGVDRIGLAVDVANRHLRLRVRAQPLQAAVAAQAGLALDEAVRQVDRQRHQFRRFIARVTEHQTLVARALVEVVVVCAIDARAMSGDCLSYATSTAQPL